MDLIHFLASSVFEAPIGVQEPIQIIEPTSEISNVLSVMEIMKFIGNCKW